MIRRMKSVWHAPTLGLAWMLMASCATSLNGDKAGLVGYEGPADASGQPPGGTGGSASVPGANPTTPETETALEFEQPHAGEHFCYVVNPDTNRVAVIDAATLAIHSEETGEHPSYLETLQGKDVAIVLNAASNDASIIRTAASGSSTVSRVALSAGSNTIRVTPDGKHAIAFFDAEKGGLGSSGSFQDVNLISIAATGAEADASAAITVGFRPSRVFFDDSLKHAFVVTEDGVSVIELGATTQVGIARTLSLGPKLISRKLDVSVTPDGKYALSRNPDSSLLSLLDLATGDVKTLDLSQLIVGARSASLPPAQSTAGVSGQALAGAAGSLAAGGSPAVSGAGGAPQSGAFAAEVSDLDLAQSGEFALAVVRNAGAAVRIPIPGAFTAPAEARVVFIPDEFIGSVTLTPNGNQALLYTTAQATVERLTVLDLKQLTWQTRDLRKIIRSVVITPDNSTAIVVHDKAPGDPGDAGLDPDLVIDRSYGYSLLKLDTNFSKLQTTAADVGPMSVMPDGSSLFILVSGRNAQQGAPDIQSFERVGLQDFIVTHVTLGSTPLSVGSVPGALKAWVSQRHPDGRITFTDFAAQNIESVTGFELNSRVRE